jgi:uncharacterized short protein YbdD (DUF466 family)
MKRPHELPNIIKSKAPSHNNIARAISGIADYSHYKKRFLSHTKTKPEGDLPTTKRSFSKQLVNYPPHQHTSIPIS